MNRDLANRLRDEADRLRTFARLLQAMPSPPKGGMFSAEPPSCETEASAWRKEIELAVAALEEAARRLVICTTE